jgi:hypothetical protein
MRVAHILTRSIRPIHNESRKKKELSIYLSLPIKYSANAQPTRDSIIPEMIPAPFRNKKEVPLSQDKPSPLHRIISPGLRNEGKDYPTNLTSHSEDTVVTFLLSQSLLRTSGTL